MIVKSTNFSIYAGKTVFHTPFDLRGMYINDSSCNNAILSNNMMAFDIRGLRTNSFTADDLWSSRRLLPDARLSEIENEVGIVASIGVKY